MNTPKQITITLSHEDADLLAMLTKRFCYSDAESVACRRYTAEDMIEAISALQIALADAGFAPR